MFEKHKAKRVQHEYEEALAQWQALRDSYANLLDTAEHYDGEVDSGLMLKGGEAVFAKVTNASLVEDRRGPGHWQGGSTGVSIPIGSVGGHSVRYRVGATRGHYVQGQPAPTAIDTGTVYITNRRVVFEGGRQTRECLFDKMIGFEHDDKAGTTVISVSNRQKPTTIHYGPTVAGWFDFRMDLALAHYRNEIPTLVANLQRKLAELDQQKPSPPPG